MNKILSNNAEELLLEDSDPGEIIGRDKQKRQLKQMVFDKIQNGGSPVSTVFMYGSSGTGKTYVVDKLTEEIQDKVDPSKISLQYINGRRHSTYYQVLVKIWNNLSNYLPVEVDGDTIHSVKNKGYGQSEVFDIIKEIVKQKEITLQVTLDEADKLKGDASEKLISMFYDLRKEGHSVQLIAVSNDPYLLSSYGDDIDRRIGTKIHFPKYNAIQLQQILTRFAQMALNQDTWDKSTLDKIGGKIGQTSGSASQAKKILYHTALKSEETLNAEYVDEAKQEVNKQMIRNEILTRPKHDKVTLQATCELDKQFELSKLEAGKYQEAKENAATTTNIHKKYEELCKYYSIEDPKSKKTVSRMLDQLQKDELVSGDLRSLGRGRGLSKFWEPLYDNSIILDIIDESMDLQR